MVRTELWGAAEARDHQEVDRGLPPVKGARAAGAQGARGASVHHECTASAYQTQGTVSAFSCPGPLREMIHRSGPPAEPAVRTVDDPEYGR